MEQSVIVERRSFFSSLNGLCIWVMWIFIILAILDIVAVFSGYAQADLLYRVFFARGNSPILQKYKTGMLSKHNSIPPYFQ